MSARLVTGFVFLGFAFAFLAVAALRGLSGASTGFDGASVAAFVFALLGLVLVRHGVRS